MECGSCGKSFEQRAYLERILPSSCLTENHGFLPAAAAGQIRNSNVARDMSEYKYLGPFSTHQTEKPSRDRYRRQFGNMDGKCDDQQLR